MERYNEYKDSGVQWLGEIPSHWEMQRWRFLLTENKDKNTGSKEKNQLQFRYGDIVRKANQDEDADILETISKYTVVAPNDIMINGLNLNYDFISQRVAQVKEKGVITSAYVSLRPTFLACSKYYTYFLKSMDFKKMFHGMGTGIRLTLSYNELKNQFIPCPSIEEQQAIASYLDEATSKIDAAIAQRQKMIDLLNERKQIIINNAVTKGLNPNVKMKDSGVDWIGEIPEQWDVIKLKYIFRRIADGTHFSPETIEEGMPYITATDVRGKGIDFNETKKISQKDYEALVAAGCKPQLNDILLVKDGATTGRVGLMIDDTDCVTLSSVAMLSPQKKYSHLYLMYMMMSDFMQKQILLSMAGAAMPRITLIKLSNFIGIVPPMDEQESIATYIEKASMPIDSAIKSAEKQISLLQERKQIIINEVVTGKVKVS